MAKDGSVSDSRVRTMLEISRLKVLHCILQLHVNDIQIDLIKDAIERSNVVDCGERRLCERQPCENNAIN